MLFTKMHGLGNKYVFFNLLNNPLDNHDLSELARSVSDVNYGIGSDGMILICPSDKADFRMRIFNADGSEGKNCGNGLRCTAKYLYDNGYSESSQFTIETLGEIVEVEVELETNHKSTVRSVKVDMGEPKLQKADLPMEGDPFSSTINEPVIIENQEFHMTCLSMGNPHAILFVDDVKKFPLERWGPKIEHATLFPERVNVGIVHVLNEQEIDYRVWERGSGLTMACGTGACAAVVAAALNNRLKRELPITVHLPGGDLTILWDANNHVWKSGPAEYICHGELAIETCQTLFSR
ncbi:diaminopimelate epimerase [Pueribacillus theae]|uniref:Diaminopimelate epimerase n=1 Tax=Pueribacillus theae TaxID=2171751 RepID=A0A2U1K6X4_9BACI|nr:diaminopimelate epimerase [Pueribacillus theae]PWA13142.1 diaminopimelate epimerase [Pueribacillus theae]